MALCSFSVSHKLVLCLSFLQQALSADVLSITGSSDATSTSSPLVIDDDNALPCSNFIDCVVSPCSYSACPSYPTAVCYDNVCGQCAAVFIDMATGQQISVENCHEFSVTEAEEEEEEEEEGEDVDYPLEVDQYQKSGHNLGVNLNDEMIDIGRNLVNYGELDINIAWPMISDFDSLPADTVSNPPPLLSSSSSSTVLAPVAGVPSGNTSNSSNTTATDATPAQVVHEHVDLYSDDPVISKYAIDNIQESGINTGLNLNDEVVDVGQDLINYGRLRFNLIPIPMHSNPSSDHDQTAAFDAALESIASVLDSNMPQQQQQSSASSVLESGQPVLCATDVTLCSDGTLVTRDPYMHCAFRPCPMTAADDAQPSAAETVQSARFVDAMHMYENEESIHVGDNELGEWNDDVLRLISVQSTTNKMIMATWLVLILFVFPITVCVCWKRKSMKPKRQTYNDAELTPPNYEDEPWDHQCDRVEESAEYV